MTVLLYDYFELEERAARHLKTWKVWHLILYSLAAIFGITNYVLLQKAMQLVGDNCILYPRELEFRVIPRTNHTLETNFNYTMDENEPSNRRVNVKVPIEDSAHDENVTGKTVAKREIRDNETMDNYFETTMEPDNVTVITGNQSHQLVVDLSRSLFAQDSECQFAEYMPVMSTVCALVWLTFFTMCSGGGRARSGLQQPWRILTPALLFAVVLVGLTGHSFSRTNGGLLAFCAAFSNFTGSNKCSLVDPFLEESWSTSWGFGCRVSLVRAASAAVLAAWACAAALLFARCLAAPDFVVRRTGVYLKDPHGKLTPHLKKSRRRLQPSPSSPGKRDNASLVSEPTCTTELATCSVERGQESVPNSLMATPIRKDRENPDLIEMTYSPQERQGLA